MLLQQDLMKKYTKILNKVAIKYDLHHLVNLDKNQALSMIIEEIPLQI